MESSYTNKRILITGGAGYLGSGLINLLKDFNCIIVRLDHPKATFLPINGAAHVEDVIGDVKEKEIWEKILIDVDIIFHFAAQTSTYAANENPPEDLNTNVMPILYLLEACRKQNVHPTVLFASTVTIVGIPAYLPVDEEHPEDPITIYDLHKLISEKYLKYYAKQGIIKGASLRLSNVYGPGPRSSRSDRGILNQMIRRALEGKTLTVYGKGEQIRDYIYVKDVAQAFLIAGENIKNINGQHFVIGSEQGNTIAYALGLIAERVALKTGNKVAIKHIDPPFPQSPIESRDFVANSQKFHHFTGWQPTYLLSEGIDSTIEDFIEGN
jgi:UDP-glucose 4-epimerase